MMLEDLFILKCQMIAWSFFLVVNEYLFRPMLTISTHLPSPERYKMRTEGVA
jgi:hypothetical protein